MSVSYIEPFPGTKSHLPIICLGKNELVSENPAISLPQPQSHLTPRDLQGHTLSYIWLSGLSAWSQVWRQSDMSSD